MWWAENDQVITFEALNTLSMSKFDIFCLIHKVDFRLANVNLRVSKRFAMYPIINTHDIIDIFAALFSPWFSLKQCSKDWNQMLDSKHVTEENRLCHIVKQFQNLLVLGCFLFFFLLVVGRFGSLQFLSYSLWVVSGRFLLVLSSFQVVSCSL